MKELKVAAYCRVSTDKEDQANSLINQKKYFSDYINKNENWSLKEIYYDDGISGTSIKHRDGFNRMIADALEGEINLIITKEVSRFARNTVDTLSYTRKLKDNNIGVFFINDNIDTRDPDGELRLSIMATIAQEESRKTSERVKWGQKRRMEQGVVFGRDLLGYTVKNGKITVNPDEIETVKLIYFKFLNEEKGTHVIARELYDAGIRPKRVKEWNNTVILRVLRNEKYVGDLCQKKTYTPNYLTHEKKYNKGNEEMVYLKDHHEPIIDRDTWNKVQKELQRRSPNNEQKSKHSNRYWCSGKLICGECGKRLVSRVKKLSGNITYRAWRCYANALHGQLKIDKFNNEIGCTSSSVNDKVLINAVAFSLKLIKHNCDNIKTDMLKEIQIVQSIKVPDKIENLDKKIIELQQKKTKTIELMIDGTISKSDLKQMNSYFDEKINDISKLIERINNAAKTTSNKVKCLEDYITEIEQILKFNSDNTALYRSIINRIVVCNDKILTIYFNSLTFGIQLKYITYGRGDNYTIEFKLNKIVE